MKVPGPIATPPCALTLLAFGEIELARLLAIDDLFAVVSDESPISPGHALIIARRPVARFRELTAAEKARLLVWIDWTQDHLASNLSPTPDAFNLGLNDGPVAGQTMPQFHFHVIPRYGGDVADPRGGIRHVIPSKARYWQEKSVPGAGYSAHTAKLPKQARTPGAGNGLSARANRCLLTAGIPTEREAVLHALRTGALYPYFRPPLYGKKTHQEVCRWAGVGESFASPRVPQDTMPIAISNGLSFRANRFLHRAGIPAKKSAVRHAIETGGLVPGKRPVSYGTQTHAELCRWAGVGSR